MRTSVSEGHHTSRSALRSALRGLASSLVINVLGTYLVYQFLLERFPSGSHMPLALSGLVPVTDLMYNIVRKQSVDIVGLFAAEEVAVSLVASAVTHSATSLLVGKSMQNAALGVIFLASVIIGRPLMVYIARQFVASGDDVHRARFDRVANHPDGKSVYRTMTLVWAIVLFAKTFVSVLLALSLNTAQFLMYSSLVNYSSDGLLVWWSIRYGYTRLGRYVASATPDLDSGEAGQPLASDA